MKLTIAIPTYNRLHFLKKQVDFFISEGISSKEDIEFIISNNASNDGTSEYLEKIKKDYEYIKVNNNKENLGLLGNFFKISELSNAEYLWMVGDDDELEKGIVDEVLRLLETYRDLTWLFIQFKKQDGKNIVSSFNFDAGEYYNTGINLYSKICESPYKLGALMFITASVLKTKYVREAIAIFKNSYEMQINNLTLPVGLTYYCALSGSACMTKKSYIVDNVSGITWSDHVNRVFFRDQIALLDLYSKHKKVKLIDTISFPECLEFPAPEWRFLKSKSSVDNYAMKFYLRNKPYQIIADLIYLIMSRLKSKRY